MTATPVVAIFDIGKTNKKLFLFNQNYEIVFERSACFSEITDEDGDACEDVDKLRLFIYDSLHEVCRSGQFDIKAINFSAYGASFVFIDKEGNTTGPLYNYLKEYPAELLKQFYKTYGGEEEFSKQTASPVLGNLNSGMQLYRLKYKKPEFFNNIKYALHLPQYLSYLLTGEAYSDVTSIGCHTNLWHFQNNQYHSWVNAEGIAEKLAPVVPCTDTKVPCLSGSAYKVGVGLHDSSAALIPYLTSFKEPFILLSTGTWCISLNPFNNTPLTKNELENDCLSYLTYEGEPVKASRLFAGYEHDQQLKRINQHFGTDEKAYQQVVYNQSLIDRLKDQPKPSVKDGAAVVKSLVFNLRDLKDYKSFDEAYHQLMLDIVEMQYWSTNLVLQPNITQIFVDGGFGKNQVYMTLLALYFPHQKVFAAKVAQATATGTALAIHFAWNNNPLPKGLVQLNKIPVPSAVG